jgi:hypothetical protein
LFWIKTLQASRRSIPYESQGYSIEGGSMELHRNAVGRALEILRSVIAGPRAVHPATDGSGTSDSRIQQAVGFADYHLRQWCPAATKPRISHQEQT